MACTLRVADRHLGSPVPVACAGRLQSYGPAVSGSISADFRWIR